VTVNLMESPSLAKGFESQPSFVVRGIIPSLMYHTTYACIYILGPSAEIGTILGFALTQQTHISSL
jgi:hypothetical protein